MEKQDEGLAEKETGNPVYKKDIFDKIMGLPVLRILEPFYQKHREGLLYLFFGALTTFLNLLLSAFFWYILHWEKWYLGDFALGTLLGNLISILIALIFAYVTNRHWVFRSQTKGAHDVGIEFLKFAGGRATTLVIEIGGVQLTTMLFPGDSVMLFIGKLITQILVILLNFVFSKLFVFREKKDAGEKVVERSDAGEKDSDKKES